MTHRLLFLDFETYYDDEYSLRKMAPPNYILDPRFETIGCAVKEGDAPSTFIDGPDFPRFIAQFDPASTTTVAFNALFDNCILAWRYGVVPSRMLCTMRMAVSLRGHLLSGHSLATVGKFLGVGTKGTAIESVKGLRRSQIIANPLLWQAFQAYANNDNDMSYAIWAKLFPEFQTAERRIMDRVIRCAVEPKFQIDTGMLRAHLQDLADDKVALLAAAGITDQGELRSTAKFEELLTSHGVNIEYKPSLTDPTRMIPAFAKTDDFMADLQEHPDPAVQAIAAARLGSRSTIEESRGARMLGIAELPWPVTVTGTMPIPLRYSGAHTHRLSGDWSLNMQNLPASRGTKKSKLRKALVAPPGHKVVVADKSQIECRLNAWFCGQHDLLYLFATGGDPYSVLGSQIFEKPVDKTTDGGLPRFIGKGGELGLGFGCGDDKFYTMVIRSARTLGMDVKKLLEVWTPLLASKSVRTYRTTHGAITSSWRQLDVILETAWMGLSDPVRLGPVMIGHGYVEGPGGLRMVYANPRRDENDELRYDYGKRSYKMYGSKFLENIIQFLARINTMHDALRISDRGFRFALQSHDELAWIVPDDKVAECQAVALEEMRRRPSWAPSLPLNAECNFGQSYGDAK